ncbi:MAG TPA: ThuA domain-containing protein [Planctomycetota bacterium]|nr:ThuA domain-containing protein [Planctomycetota bacterium]HRR80707.1 ThuA domain-containing protein [Planctomycetota bacterium]
MSEPLRVTVWNEGRHEKKNEQIARIYPEGMHGAIARYLRGCTGFDVRTATLDEPDHGLPDDVLAATDVLIWWGHMAHHEVRDAIVDKVVARVLDGMGLVVLHSGHFSKPFRRLMGTSCNLKWREAGEKERLWVIEPGHPIVQGIGEYIEIPHEEMYGERFDIPEPDALVLVSWFAGGEVFRSGCCFRRHKGKIFYFRPGHETYPTYYHEGVMKILANGVRWAAPVPGADVYFGHFKPLEKLETA